MIFVPSISATRAEKNPKPPGGKQTVEPVFGIVKEAMGFRQFHLRGESKVEGEWDLVTLAYNMKRLWNLKLAEMS